MIVLASALITCRIRLPFLKFSSSSSTLPLESRPLALTSRVIDSVSDSYNRRRQDRRLPRNMSFTTSSNKVKVVSSGPLSLKRLKRTFPYSGAPSLGIAPRSTRLKYCNQSHFWADRKQ
jgi:hypothetical protein